MRRNIIVRITKWGPIERTIITVLVLKDLDLFFGNNNEENKPRGNIEKVAKDQTCVTNNMFLAHNPLYALKTFRVMRKYRDVAVE